MLALQLGRGMPKEGSPSSMYSSTSEKRGRTRKPKALCSSMFCLLARGQLLRGSEEPLVERFGVHELLVPLAHQRVQVVSGVLLPELAQHLLLVPRVDAHHDLCLSQNSMVFRVSSLSKRSARKTCLMARIVAGVGGGSSASGSSATGAGTGAAACSGAAWTVGGALGLFLLPGASLCHASSAQQPAAQPPWLLLWPQQVPRPPQQSLQLSVLPLRRQQWPRPCCFFFTHFLWSEQLSRPGRCRSSGWCRAGRPRCPRSQ